MGGGGHDSHGAAAAEPIIETGGTVDRVLKLICVFVVCLLAGWGMLMTQPIKQAQHESHHETVPNIPSSLGGGEEAAGSHSGGEAGEVMTGPPAESHGTAGEQMSGPPKDGGDSGEAMTAPPPEHH